MWAQDNLASVVGLGLVGKIAEKRVAHNLLPPLLVLLFCRRCGWHGRWLIIRSRTETRAVAGGFSAGAPPTGTLPTRRRQETGNPA